MSRILVVMVGMLVASAAVAQDAVDLARGTVDPYSIADQRAKFLRAAGADSELDEAEFKADAERGNGFVSKFDSWDQISMFDKNGNKTIDWFEADEYRKDLRARILAQFDKDNDRRLRGDERTAANDALAKGTFTKASRQAQTTERRPERPSADAPRRPQPDANAPRRPGADGAPQRGPQFGNAEQRAQLLERFDANNDGELTGEELQQAREAMREQFQARQEERRREFMQRFDTNGDGQIDESEREAIRRDFELRRFDRDGDGQLNAEEQAAATAAREQFEARRREFMERFDTDGDGQISEEERAAIREAFRNRGPGAEGQPGQRGRGQGNRPGGQGAPGGRGGNRGGNNAPDRGEL